MDIWIFGGQSNMQGQTECDPLDRPIANAFEYKFLTDSLVPLKNPVGEDIGELLLASHLGHGSLVPYFVKEYIKNTGRKVLAVHAAKGATVIDQWLKTSENGQDRYAMTVKKIRAAKAKAETLERIENVYYVWLQGESDALLATSREKYAKMLTRFKNDLKKDVGIQKFFIIEVGYFAVHFNGKDKDEAIQSAQEALCRMDEDFLLLTDITKTLSLHSENMNLEAVGHYNNSAMKRIGKTAGKKAAEICALH